MAKREVPSLRKGLTVDELLAGTWMIGANRYFTDGEITGLSDEIVRYTIQGLIDYADNDGRVTRRTVISTLCSITRMLTHAKDHITSKMSEGEFTPTVLDRIANA